MKRKVIIDTDPGHDDAMALMLAVKSELFDIQAITTICGNSILENTTRNARYILDLLENKSIPLYSGSPSPLKRSLIQAVVHGKSGLDGINPTNKGILTNNAVEKILAIVDQNPRNSITLITLGPLTNIARAIRQNTETMRRVKEIVIMGGAIKVAGNKNRVAEFNIFVDPEAADIVFRFDIPKTLVPLDACNNVQLTLDEFKKITNTHLRSSLLKMLKPYIRNLKEDVGVEAALMYDPLTVYYLINPKACRTYKCNIAIEIKGVLTRGMTVADLRYSPDERENVTVVEFIDQEKFKKYFISTLSKK